MHRITDVKMTGASRMNLEMLKAVCGAHYFQNVVLATSMWDAISRGKPITDFEAREAELIASPAFWGDLLDRGAVAERYMGDHKSGARIVDTICRKHPAATLEIILEMRSTSLEYTTAGQILTEELRKREQTKLKEQEEEERELRAEVAEKEARLKDIERNLGKSEAKKHGRSQGKEDKNDRDFARDGAQASWFTTKFGFKTK